MIRITYNNGLKFDWLNVNEISKEEIKRLQEEYYEDKIKDFMLERINNVND